MPFIAIVYCFLLLVAWAIGIARYSRLSIAFKILSWSFPVVFLCNIISPFWINRFGNNAPILHVESLTDYVFFAATFYYLLKSKTTKKIIIISMVIVAFFVVINAIYWQGFYTKFPTNVYFLTQPLLAIFSLLLFKEMLMYPLKINPVQQSAFWYNTAILFYATTMFFYLGLSNYFPEHNLHDHFFYYFWYLIFYVFDILLAVATLTDNQKTTLENA